MGMKIERQSVIRRLVDLQYQRSEYGTNRSTFRVRGENIDVYLAYEQSLLRITLMQDSIKSLTKLDPLSGKKLEDLTRCVVFPAKHFLTSNDSQESIFMNIRQDLQLSVSEFKKRNRLIEAQRISQRVNYDLEMIGEMGYVNGIENYSRYFDGRKPGEAPFSLLDYFSYSSGRDWLLFIDESHMTVPQIRGMYNGDRSRKQTLIDFGFRLPSALDNRPLKFDEFQNRIPKVIYVSATPADWEIKQAGNIAELLVRPTGIVDPEISVRKTENQLTDLITEIINRKKQHARVLVTTLTKRMAEDLAKFFSDRKYKSFPEFNDLKQNEIPRVQYLHSDIVTLERSDILDDLRLGKYDCLIGINLLREGLDLPEVSLVAILDADKEGFLRSETALIQTMGRAARHIKGQVIMYADKITPSMSRAIREIERRRLYQINYNKSRHFDPVQIVKPIREKLVEKSETEEQIFDSIIKRKKAYNSLLNVRTDDLTPFDAKKIIKNMEREMRKSASELNFELAAALRDRIREINKIFS